MCGFFFLRLLFKKIKIHQTHLSLFCSAKINWNFTKYKQTITKKRCLTFFLRNNQWLEIKIRFERRFKLSQCTIIHTQLNLVGLLQKTFKNSIKNFQVFHRHLCFFAISQSVCPCRLFQPILIFTGKARSLPESGAFHNNVILHNLRMLVISWSVCTWYAFPTYYNVFG